ncbi:MAG TPA: FtsK/SpoIIIE domain-containing protein, partial [Acidobacteriota bacterium]
SPAFQPSMKLPFALGRRADGEPIVADIAGMPHLLVAGSTGSGKSVLIHDLILSLLFRHRPDELKLMLIDPKRLELTFYEGIPHLYDPRQHDYDCRVLTDPKEAAKSLKKCERLMELRYERFSKYGVRDLEGYNAEASRRGEPQEFYLVVVIDELADLMLTSGLAVEDSILRLAQMARAVGIHLVIATQRPSVDVITGVIKANFPSRISFRVTSRVDSRTILDSVGAEKLLGKGDMLFLPPGSARLRRIHGAFVSEVEIAALVKMLKAQGKPNYNEAILNQADRSGGFEGERDDRYEEAVRLVVRSGSASVSHLQRKLKLGYSRAARLVDIMEADGLVGPQLPGKQRDVLVPRDYFDQVDAQLR